jgi:hypothetical protein
VLSSKLPLARAFKRSLAMSMTKIASFTSFPLLQKNTKKV